MFNHDWPTLATGVAIPHGLYDITDNVGYIQINTTHDTSELACDSIRYWWNTYGKVPYHPANSILLLSDVCDGGCNNNSLYYIFKQDLQALVNELAMEIPIPDDPPYTCKYNLITHPFFPHISPLCQGLIFESFQTLKVLRATATTRTRLKLLRTIFYNTYQIG